MSSSETSKQQRLWTLSARGWAPTRGVHRGLACDECGAVKEDMYRSGSKTACEDHRAGA